MLEAGAKTDAFSSPLKLEAPRGAAYHPARVQEFPNAKPSASPELHPPIEEEAPRPRRRFELISRTGFSYANCTEEAQANQHCAGAAKEPSLGGAVLWRITPYFALGGVADLRKFTIEPNNQELEELTVSAHFIGLVGRVYFLDEGSWDPYAELAWGHSIVSAEYAKKEPDEDTPSYKEISSGNGVKATFGVDFYISENIRIGPSLSYTQLLEADGGRCKAGRSDGCAGEPSNLTRYLSGYLQLDFQFSYQFGRVW